MWKYYKKNKWILKGLNFDIHKGEIVAFLGHNGAGKTTTMKCIMNLVFPQKGSVKIFGIENKNPDFKKYIGYLPENAFLPPYYKVKEVIKIACTLRGIKWSNLEGEISKLIEYFELIDYNDKYIGSLSKGTLQKVSLIVSIISSSHLYLWDEPTQNLDPIIRKKLSDFIQESAKNGKSFLISSHILTEVEKIATRVMIIKQGELIINERIDNILKTGKTLEEIYLEVHN
ncbi:MAG: ABC transporter ATP-binding protein [candidate division WOR-3 bacterium]